MERCWRWFGPGDAVPLAAVREAGATGVVTALHDDYRGAAWSEAAVRARRDAVEAAGLRWSVVESIPVTSAVKRRRGHEADVDAFLASLRAVAAAGVRVVCHNFMPVVDWTRTDLDHPLATGARALRFDPVALAAYDALVLERPGAREDHADLMEAAERHLAAIGLEGAERLERTLIAGLPGAEDSHGREGFRARLAEYADTDADALRANLIAFLADAAPEAERLGVRLALHPDDPPRPIFGLPRVASTAEDYEAVLGAVDTPANGVTFCAGSLGAREGADLPAIAARLAPRTHFLHLRRVAMEPGGAFHEAEHVGGRVLVEVIRAFLAEEARRREEGRADHDIPMRPDHGALMTGDPVGHSQPGYSWLGRLKGMAELRGMIEALGGDAG